MCIGAGAECTNLAAASHVCKISVEKANNDQNDHSRYDTPKSAGEQTKEDLWWFNR